MCMSLGISQKVMECMDYHIRLPNAFQVVIEAENLLPNSPDLNPVGYSVWGLATGGVITKFQALTS